MNELERDRINVRVLGGISGASRLEYCIGAHRAASDPELRELYDPDAYVPASQWTSIESPEPACIPADSSNTVALTAVPAETGPAILELLKRTRNIVTPMFNAMDLTRDELGELIPIVSQIPGIRVSEDPQQVMRYWYPAGFPTATFSARSGKQVGLHVDIWEGLAWRHSWRGGNRISMNLSTSERYFVFVPMQACRIAALLIQNNSTLNDGNFDVAAEYLRLHPQSILYRIRVEPGEAYVAPTENIIHDGIPVRYHVDDTLIVRGRFEILG